MIQHQQIPAQPQVMFDFVQSEMNAINYLVAPGVTVYLLDQTNQVLYEKTYQTFKAYDLSERQVQQNQNGSGNITREEISQMIADALHQYNPHIPKKERNNGQPG
ncbi:MAG: hypothetical protein J6Y02_18440 [Pseudobutyrivibrio sp.]|nr:hypothetical protein [Pseudobutyrivibrio sp.]